jgi:hypothetical protein
MGDLSPRKDRRAAILQSCYIPWKGYFDIIATVDVFVVYDDVKYSKNHWHNRNLIKTQHGLKWLTVPVSHGGVDSIDSTRIARPFAHKHWRSIAQSYARAPFFRKYSEQLEHCFKLAGSLESLSAVNVLFLKALCGELGIRTEIISSRDIEARGTATERLLKIVRGAGADRYLSGPSARAYFDEEVFKAAGVTPEWMDYHGYPEYEQLHGGFEHAVSVLDLLFNTGPHARRYLRRTSSPIAAFAEASATAT